jgi:arylsulfatase A-like enzyme
MDQERTMKPIVLLALFLALLPGCARKAKHPNIVLITVDTLRPDRLGYGGNSRATSPRLDRLSKEGVVFTHATSVAGWTLPAMATIFTGRLPSEHGATDFHWSLDASLPSLASILRANGYDTYGFVSHVMLTPTYGMGEGFGLFDFSVLNVGDPHEVTTGQQLTELALSGIRGAKEPFFLWVHYFDPHFKYITHEQFDFGPKDIDRYDSEIAFTDYHIDNLLKAVDHGNTIVIFTADHGEEFGEHGSKYHYTLHGEVMRVPLVIKGPGMAPRSDDQPAQQTDFMPTILALAGIAPPEGLHGHNLLEPRARDIPQFIERDRPPQWQQRGVIQGEHKLIVVENADTTQVPPSSLNEEIPVFNVRPGIYLYDLARDPGEQTNLFSNTDSTSLRLLGLVARQFSGPRRHGAPVQVDEELLEKLRSLGYVH